MYLALIPNQLSKNLINNSVQDCHEDLHLTLLFSKDRLTIIPNSEVQSVWDDISRTFDIMVQTIDLFGPNKDSWVLKTKSWFLDRARLNSENLFKDHNISWDQTWSFNPHVTIKKGKSITLVKELPSYIVFDKIELRY